MAGENATQSQIAIADNPSSVEDIYTHALNIGAGMKDQYAQSINIANKLKEAMQTSTNAGIELQKQVLAEEQQAFSIMRPQLANTIDAMQTILTSQREHALAANTAANQIIKDNAISFWSDPLGKIGAWMREGELQDTVSINTQAAQIAANANHQLANSINQELPIVATSVKRIDEGTQQLKLKQFIALANERLADSEMKTIGQNVQLLSALSGQDVHLANMAAQYVNQGMAKEHLSMQERAAAQEFSYKEQMYPLNIEQQKLQNDMYYRKLEELKNEDAVSQAQLDAYNKIAAAYGRAPVNSIDALKRLSKNPSTKAVTDVLFGISQNYFGQIAAGINPSLATPVIGSDPYSYLQGANILGLMNDPNISQFDKELLTKLNNIEYDLSQPQRIPDPADPTGLREKIIPGKINDTQSEIEKASTFSREVFDQFKRMQLDPEDSKSNPYRAPPLKMFESFGVNGFNQSKFFTEILKPAIDAGVADNSAEYLVTQMIIAKDKGLIHSAEIPKLLGDIFENVRTQNNANYKFDAKHLPLQEHFYVKDQYAKPGTASSYDMLNENDRNIYSKVMEFNFKKQIMPDDYYPLYKSIKGFMGKE